MSVETLRTWMRDVSLPDSARDFRTIVADEGVSISLDRGSSPTSRDPHAGNLRWLVDREGSDLLWETENVRDITRTIHGETYPLNAESFFRRTMVCCRN